MKCSSERASPGRVERLVAPLQEPLGVREVALLLDVRGGRHQEDLGLRCPPCAARPTRTSGESLPEARGLDLGEVAHDEPLELRRARAACSPACCEPTAGFWPITNSPSRPPSSARSIVGKCEWLPEIFGRCGEAVVVLRRRGVAEPGLQQRDDVLVEVRPPAALGAARRRCSPRASARSSRAARHVQVAGQQVVERRDVGRALDRRVAAHRHDAAARAADVAEQQLEDRAGADHLHAGGVLRPADRVDERGRALAARSWRSACRRPRGTCSCGMPQTRSTISGV